MTTSNHAFSAFSFLSFILTSIPFAWHLEAWNTGTCIFMGWIATASLLLFVNSVVWDGNAINWTPVYCDIFTKFFIGLTVSIPAASLCINRRLYYIVRVNCVTRTAAERRKNMFTDLAIGVGIPIIVMILHVIVQGHRFDIFEDVGCWPATYNTHLTYVLVLGPTLGVSLFAAIYAILNVITLRKNYIECKKLLSSSSTRGLTASRYIRLMCLGGVEALADVPLNVAAIITSAKAGIEPWVSWEDTHSGFSRVDQFPAVLWRSMPPVASNLERVRWSIVLCGFVFFAFFGFADEARRNYHLAYKTVASKLGWRLVPTSGVTSNGNSNSSPGGSKKEPIGINGTESWSGSLSAFADRFKLVVLRSSGSVSLSGNSAAGDDMEPLGTINGLPVHVTKEMIQKRDADAASTFTTLTEMTTWTSSSAAGSNLEHQEPVHTMYKVSQSACVEGLDENLKSKSGAPSQMSLSLPASVSPTPNGSFLDLSVSGQEIPPPPCQDTHLVEHRV